MQSLTSHTQQACASSENHALGATKGLTAIGFGEFAALIGMLLVYAAISFFLWGSFEIHYDNPGYTDPAASYVLGQGFTSGCWYFQECDEFWAGNVPLHQFLLIPWFKVFGFSNGSLIAINLFYITAAMGLFWRGMWQNRLVSTAGLRLGAVAFFLVSDSSLNLAINGRPEPLCLLIACSAWAFFGLEWRYYRWAGIAGCGVLAPWAALHLAAFFAFMGMGALLYFKKRYLKEVIALAVGGVIGSLALLGFYQHMGILPVFLKSISPHISISASNAILTTKDYIEWAAFAKSWGWKLSGFTNISFLFPAFLSVWVSCMSFLNGRACRLAALNIGCVTLLPALFLATGVFPKYYGFYLLLPITLTLFGLISAGVIRDGRGARLLSFFFWLSVAMPGAYFWASVVQAWPTLCSGRQARMDAFAKNVVRSTDVAWVDRRLWYATKPIVKKTFSTLWRLQSSVSKSRDEISVIIALSKGDDGKNTIAEDLPGEWKPTGEHLLVPDFSRYYRSNKTTEPLLFEVYRRTDRP